MANCVEILSDSSELLGHSGQAKCGLKVRALTEAIIDQKPRPDPRCSLDAFGYCDEEGPFDPDLYTHEEVVELLSSE